MSLVHRVKTILLSVTLTALIIGGASYYFFYKNCHVLINMTPSAPLWDERPGDEPPVTIDTLPTATGTLSYYVPEMGLRFEYPAYATVTVDITNSTVGSLLSGHIYLSPDREVRYGRSISFSGLTPDYVFTKPMTRDVTYTTGFFTDGDGVYYTLASDKENSSIPVAYTIPLASPDEMAVVINDDEYIGAGGIVAIINTNNDRFPGVAFSGFVQTPEDIARFESIIRSIELE